MKNTINTTMVIFCVVFLSCNSKEQDLVSFRSPPEANKKSIYSDFEIGDNEWYLTNPKDSVQLYLFEWGQGKDTVVVLHGGFGAEHRYLKDAFEGLYDKYHFVFYDQRGSLRSPCPKEKISIQDHISDLEVIRKELGVEKLNLFGHSNGTTLASLYLREHPDRVKGFVMTACMQMEYPIKESDSVLKALEILGYEDFNAYVERQQVKDEIAKIEMDSTLSPAKKQFQIQRINQAKWYIYDISLWKNGKETYGPLYSQISGNATVKSMQALLPNGYSNIQLYQNHPYPITIIMGEKDMIDPDGHKFAHWTKNLSNVQHVLIAKASHDPWIDRPEAFKEAFIKAMEKIKS
ncbi:MAG: alpha/beta hydrolase [Muricauda sp.]|nr:alpha/beta hydrolase [Allomuricauda sp.]